MKLASLEGGARDGRLVVVSRDLTRFTDASFLVPTLQAALDDWRRIAPHLAALAESLDHGAVPSERFHEHAALSPLPRAYQRLHAATGQRIAQGVSDSLVAPRAPIGVMDPGITIAPEIAVVTDDVPAGAAPEHALDAIRLVMLAVAVSRDAGSASAGALPGATLPSAFSPVAVTPDELGDAWEAGVLALPLGIDIKGKPSARTDAAAETAAGFPALIAEAARHRPLAAGMILGTGAGGAVSVDIGDTVRVEMKDRRGHSIFGAIEQTVERVRKDG
ncbi:MAG: fumarylacetoacetate hydrolase family protein [Rhizobiaceae bacterium]|nr:fumarylacetoacetate hydrolase family protein [Rhizobiaceae bacterium]